MSDKKNEDYVVRMPESPYEKEGRDPFASRSPSGRPYNGAPGQSLPSSVSKLDNSPIVSVLAYCMSSISMTIVNKYVVSGKGWNINFFYLTIQAIVCTATIIACKKFGVIKSLAPFETDRAKKCTACGSFEFSPSTELTCV